MWLEVKMFLIFAVIALIVVGVYSYNSAPGFRTFVNNAISMEDERPLFDDECTQKIYEAVEDSLEMANAHTNITIISRGESGNREEMLNLFQMAGIGNYQRTATYLMQKEPFPESLKFAIVELNRAICPGIYCKKEKAIYAVFCDGDRVVIPSA